jgi:hypothetical protein
VRYAYTPVYYENNTSTTRTPTIQNCLFEDNVRGLHFVAANNAASRNEPLVSGNTFTDNTGVPIVLENTNYPVYSGNTFNIVSMLPPTKLPRPGILLIGNWYTSGTWTSVIGIESKPMAYVVQSPISIFAAATVTVPGSSVIKLEDSDSQLIVDGILLLQSTASTKITFTSFKDDLVLYDTNGDGAATSPTRGDWKGIYLHNSANVFHDSIVKYSTYGLAVESKNANELNPSILQNTFEKNTNGVYLDIQSSGHITSLISGNSFEENINGAYLDIQSSGHITSLISDNTFIRNDYGLRTDATTGTTGIATPTLQNNTFTQHYKYPIYLGGTASPIYLNNAFSNNTNRGIALSGWFGEDATLTLVPGDTNSPFNGKNFPYAVIDNLTIGINKILTIPASTMIKTALGKEINVKGGLLLQSTALPADHITFTSLRDDSYDDTNADGTSTLPARSNWKGLYLSSNLTTNFEYVIFKYAEEGLVILKDSTEAGNLYPFISHNQFSENYKAIILRIKSNFNITSQITNNSIFSNNFGIVMNSDTSTSARYWGCNWPTLQSNVITGHADFPIFLNGSADPVYVSNTFSNNTHPAIALGGYWACDATWKTVIGDNSQPFPYVVYGWVTQDWITPVGPSTITIPAGTVIKFDRDMGMYAWGKLDFQSTPTNKIILTSYKDDRYSGDTNADGSASTPSRTDWKTVWFGGDTPTKTSLIHDLVVHYAVSGLGVYYNGAVNTAISTMIRDTLLEENHGGILLAVNGPGDIAAQIQDVTFNNNNYGLLTFATTNSTGIIRPVVTRAVFNNTANYPIYLGGTSFPSFIDTVVHTPFTQKSITSQEGGHETDFNLRTAQVPLELSIEGENLPGVSAARLRLEKLAVNAPEPIAAPSSGLTASAFEPGIALAGAWNNSGELVVTDTVYVLPGSYPIYLIIDGVTTTVADNMTIGGTNAANSRVTFMEGSIIKFALGRQMIVKGGLNLMMSTEASPTIFTSIRDDSVGGDTNRNGAANLPAKGDWVGVKLTSSMTSFEYAVLRYASEGLHINCDGAINQNISPEVSNSIFSNNTNGITLWAQNAGDILSPEENPGIHHNLFLNNTTHIFGHINQTPTGATSSGRLMMDILYNDFLPSTNFGINNASLNWTINAIDNYWGHASGPYNASSNPSGHGVPVSLRVNFTPWSQSPYHSGATSSIHGRITISNITHPQPGIAGVTVTLLPDNRTTITNQEGYYSFDGLPMGVYSLVPSLAGWLFAPSQYRVDLVADARVDFIGTLGTSDYYLTIDNVTVVQPVAGNVNAVFKIRLSKPATFPVVVEYRTQDGTATSAGNDYVAVSSLQVTFNPGVIEKTISITVKPGPIDEGEEYFKVYLQNPVPSTSINLLPNGDYGFCTITPPSNFVFLPTVRK